MKNIISLALISLLLAYGCAYKKDKYKNNLYFANNYESVRGWFDNPHIIKHDGHSGKYVCRVDKDNIYSLGLEIPFMEISTKDIKKVNVSVWIKVENMSASAKLVTEIRDNHDNVIYWKGILTNDYIKKTGKWFQMSISCGIPINLTPDSRVKVYLLNQSSENLYIDDMEILFDE